jgi:predicted amidophosphoribosyltransferase
MQRALFETMQSIHQSELAYSPDPVCEGEECGKPIGDMEEFCPHCLSTLFGEVI